VRCSFSLFSLLLTIQFNFYSTNRNPYSLTRIFPIFVLFMGVKNRCEIFLQFNFLLDILSLTVILFFNIFYLFHECCFINFLILVYFVKPLHFLNVIHQADFFHFSNQMNNNKEVFFLLLFFKKKNLKF